MQARCAFLNVVFRAKRANVQCTNKCMHVSMNNEPPDPSAAPRVNLCQKPRVLFTYKNNVLESGTIGYSEPIQEPRAMLRLKNIQSNFVSSFFSSCLLQTVPFHEQKQLKTERQTPQPASNPKHVELPRIHMAGNFGLSLTQMPGSTDRSSIAMSPWTPPRSPSAKRSAMTVITFYPECITQGQRTIAPPAVGSSQAKCPTACILALFVRCL